MIPLTHVETAGWNIEEFKEYFKGEYVKSDLANWFEGASSFCSTTLFVELCWCLYSPPIEFWNTDFKLNLLQHIVCNLELGKLKIECFFSQIS